MALIINNELVDIKQTVNRKSLLGVVVESRCPATMLTFNHSTLNTNVQWQCWLFSSLDERWLPLPLLMIH